MANNTHSALTGAELHVPGYVQTSDPGAVGAGRLWIDTTLGAGKWAIKLRKADNSGWEYAAYVGTDVRISTSSRPTLTLDDSAGSSLLGRVVFASAGTAKLSLTYDLSADQLKVYDEPNNAARLRLDRMTGKLTVGGEANIVGDLNHDGSSAGFYGTTPVARPTYAAPSGTISRASLNTGTATLPNVAQAVGALITDLRAVGLLA
jgi:hypothetical protein